MTIYRSSGKNTEVYEEYELYTKEYVENVGGKSNFLAKGGTTIGENPKTAKPLEIRNLYVKVRLAEDYKGEFGFDWVDVNPDTLEIEKIQDVPYEEVEYFYKEDPNGLGNIVKKSADEMGAKHAIQRHYEFSPISKFIDIPYVLLMPTKKAVLSAEIILWQGAINEDVVAITGDEFYEFTIIGGEKEGKTAKKKVTAAEKIKFEVECLKPGAIDKTYEFKHSNPITGSPAAVGGVRMMENKVLKLKFRIIALVSSDGSPSTKAKALFQKFNDKGIADYLNKNSLNQAGYEVEIENQEMFENLGSTDVDDYLFAFDKEDWTKRNLFSVDKDRKKYTLVKGEDKFDIEQQEGQIGDFIEQDGVDEKGDKKYKVTTNDIDFITIKEYKNKLKSKNKSYETGGIIILSDLECTDSSIAAYSRISPVNHYALLIYSSGIDVKVNYAHEIGHMLGLEHTFFENEDIKSFEKSKKYMADLQKYAKTIEQGNYKYYPSKKLVTRKELIIKALDDCKISIRKEIDKSTLKYKQNEKLNGNFTINSLETINGKPETVTKNVSKQEFLTISRTRIEGLENQEKTNTLALEKFRQKTGFYINFEDENEFYLFKEDLLSIIEDYKKYYIKLISSNYNRYLQKKTTNIMDYGDADKRIRFLNHQILIMRGDYENY
jgi:hypothetical protein